MLEFFKKTFEGGVLPQGACCPENSAFLWLNAISDLAITVACYAIPILLFPLVRKRKDFADNRMVLAFGAFLLACGTTHLLGVWTVWHATYRLDGAVKAFTALTAVSAALLLAPMLPGLIAMRNSARETGKSARPAEILRRQTELLELAHDAILIREPDGAIRFWNRGAEALYGWPREQALGRSAQDLLHPRYPKKVEEMLSELEQSGFWEGELVHTRRDGSAVTVISRWVAWRNEDRRIEIVEINRDISQRKDTERVEISFSPIETEDGMFGIGSVRDARERKELERVLREKNLALERASAAKDLFLSNMSHELRTPLNAIIGFTGTLLMRLAGPLTGEQERQLRRIQAGGKHLLTLVGDLLDLAKLESGKVEVQLKEASCQDVLREVVSALQPMAAAKALAFEAQFPEQPLMVQTDPRALGQIVFNLGNNAIKFTPRGSVRIEVGANGENAAAIHVVDTGAGIKAEDQRKLFQSFERINPDARTNGAGIGLYLSWKLAGMIGARIELQSEYGKGSRFTLFLPRGDAL